MAAGDRSHSFQTILRQKGIAEASSAIPEEIGRYKQGVPHPDDLVPIPPIEKFPLDEPAPPSKLPQDEGHLLFTQFQLQSIATTQASGDRPSASEPSCVGPILEFPTEFESAEAFIQFKRELNTVFHARSAAYGWPRSFSVCRFPTCLNSAAPPFQYCLYHLPMDREFESQKLVSVCRAQIDDHQCTTPCGFGSSKCTFHRSLGKESNK
jgi:hypothetical protein